MSFRLLDKFRSLFEKRKYEHRKSNLGDLVAAELYEDLLGLNRSPKLCAAIREHRRVVNAPNVVVGRKTRRGDGTFGEIVPSVPAVIVDGYSVARAPIANLEIGAETKILAKAMIKQIDRVISDLARQAEHFRTQNKRAICVAIVGVNFAEKYVSYEGRRRFPTDGRHHKHPIQEAEEAEDRLHRYAASAFDEFLVLRFSALNTKPFPFVWLDESATTREYASALVRISSEYDQRF